MIAIDLSKQQALGADPKTIQQINFTGNLAQEGTANTTKFFIIEEAKETILDFSQGIVIVLSISVYQYKMTQYNTLNLKLSNSQLNKPKFGIKNGTEVTLKLSSNVVGYSNDKNNFPHKLLLANTQVSNLCKAIANNSSANIKLSKTQLHKIGQSGGFLG